jgi:F-type H+-transporting ATPase subunit b
MGRLDPLFRHLRLLAVLVAVGAAGVGGALAAETAPHGADATSDAVTAPGEPQHDPSATVHDGAADEHGAATGEHATSEAAGEHAAEGGHGSGGLPQLDARTFPSQIFWLILAFATLYYLLYKRALPRVSEILEARQERIAADLDRAASLRADAEEAMRRHEAVVAEAHAKAAASIKATQDRIAAEAAERQAALEAELGQKLADAEARIGAARDAALAQIQDVAVEVAQSAVERLSGLRLGADEVKATLDRVLREAA